MRRNYTDRWWNVGVRDSRKSKSLIDNSISQVVFYPFKDNLRNVVLYTAILSALFLSAKLFSEVFPMKHEVIDA